MSGFSGGIPSGSAPPYPDAAFHNVTVAGSLTGATVSGSQTISGALNVTGGETIGGATSIGGALTVTAASTVVSASFTGATVSGGNTGTLTNSPHTGNPFTFLEVNVNGTLGCVPVFSTT